MKQLFFALAVIAFAAPVHSEESLWGSYSIVQSPSLHPIPLLIATESDVEIFRLLPGGCIRGPAVLFGKDGEEIFRLAAGDLVGDCMIVDKLRDGEGDTRSTSLGEQR